MRAVHAVCATALAWQGCHASHPDPVQGTTLLLGRWEYVAPRRAVPARPSLGAGLRVSLQFDSTAHDTAFGRVVRWFAGDVGKPPATFGTVTGVVTGDGVVSITIPSATAGVAPMTLTATVAGRDTLTITTASFAQGPGALLVRSVGPPTAKP